MNTRNIRGIFTVPDVNLFHTAATDFIGLSGWNCIETGEVIRLTSLFRDTLESLNA